VGVGRYPIWVEFGKPDLDEVTLLVLHDGNMSPQGFKPLGTGEAVNQRDAAQVHEGGDLCN
jgi:hypothetical protein